MYVYLMLHRERLWDYGYCSPVVLAFLLIFSKHTHFVCGHGNSIWESLEELKCKPDKGHRLYTAWFCSFDLCW